MNDELQGRITDTLVQPIDHLVDAAQAWSRVTPDIVAVGRVQSEPDRSLFESRGSLGARWGGS